ncbi:MAG: hypothetical protein ABF723_05185 [Lentilactobacillus hilgardii]|uniref:hypothetical protein n=1 Tax=Lentilactobacillus hilgardii TaxID=1588 RepID=UPI0039ECAA46
MTKFDTDGFVLEDGADYWLVSHSQPFTDSGEYILDDVDAIDEYLAEHGEGYQDSRTLIGAEMRLLQNHYVIRGRWHEDDQCFGNMPWNENDDLKDSLTQGELK